MEEKVNEPVNVPEVVNETPKDIAEPSPIVEKLEAEAEKQKIDMPEKVVEVAEAAINEASIQAGEVKPEPAKVEVKKPTKRDPIVLYNGNVVLWFIDTE
jgi:hypothetical protein